MLAGQPLPPPPSISRQREAIERHLGLLVATHGEANALKVFRKFGVRYSELHPCAGDVKMAFVAVKTADDWQRMLDRWYGDESAYPPVIRRSRPESLIAAGASWNCETESR